MSTFKEIKKGIWIEGLVLGLAQLLLWGGSFFLPAILSQSIIKETGWSHEFVSGAFSFAMLVSGLVAPRIGKSINTSEKNYVLLFSGVVMAMGLALLALSFNKALFVTGWTVIGVGMGMGLYDALFASLGRKYGTKASQSIVLITLISGFVTTTVWPALRVLLVHYGWHNTCFIYAAVIMALILPIHYFTVFKLGRRATNTKAAPAEKQPAQTQYDNRIYWLLVTHFTIGSLLMTGIYVYLIDILTHHHIPLAHAIAIGGLLGPGQVSIRILDMLFPKKTPVRAAIISSATIFLAFVLLTLGPQIAFLGVIAFGLGNGMRSILRGTLPLWIYGQENYAEIMGRLARLPLVAQALTPFIGSLIIQYLGIGSLLNILCLLAAINIALMVVLQQRMNKRSNLHSITPQKERPDAVRSVA